MAHWLSESASNERKRDMNAETVWSERFKSRPAPIIRRHDRESDEKEKSTVLGMDAEQHFFKRRRCGDDDDGVRTDSSVGTVGYSASEDEGKDVSSHFSRSTVVANTASRPKANPSSIEIANVAEAMCLLPSRNTAICVNENDSDVVIDSPPPPVNEEPSTAAGASVTSDQGAIEQASNQNEQTYNVRGADVNSLDQAEALSARIAAKREESLRKLGTMVSENPPGFGTDDSQSRFKGCYYVLGGRWESKITYKSKTRHIGTFDTDVEAALAFDIHAHQLNVSSRCNFLYDDQGNLISKNPHGGIRKVRHRTRATKRPLQMGVAHPINYPHFNAELYHHVSPTLVNNRGCGGVRSPHSTLHRHAPQSYKTPYPWTFNNARRVFPVYGRREEHYDFHRPPILAPQTPPVYHQHHQYGYDAAVGGQNEAFHPTPTNCNLLTTGRRPWNLRSYRDAPNADAAAEVSRAAAEELHGKTSSHEDADECFLI